MLTFTVEQEFHDESLNSYLARLAGENFLGSVSALLRPVGVRYKSTYSQDELAATALCHSLELPLLERLARFQTVLGALGGGQFLRRHGVPVCPVCLSHQAYGRQAWHHELVTACSKHRIMLVAACPDCLEPVALNGGTIGTCQCGFDLAAAPAIPADRANLFVSGVLAGSQMHVATLTGLNITAGVPADVDRFFLFLANLTLSVKQRKNAAISVDRAIEINRACFLLAENLEERFRAFVVEQVAKANELASGRYMHSLGDWYRELNATFASDAYAGLREMVYRILLREAKAPINRKMKQIGAALLEFKETLTAAEAARALGTSAERLVAFVRCKKLKGTIISGSSNEYCLVARREVEALKEAAAELITGKDLLAMLNITRRVRERLIESGVLQRMPECERPLFAKGQFRRHEVEGLLQQLDQHYDERVVESTLGLDELSSRRFSDQQALDLFRRIFSGQLKPVQKSTGMQGLLAFRFDADEVRKSIRQDAGLFELTITDLTKLTRWKHETIKAWIEQGLLPARSESKPGGRRVYISVANLISFLSQHVVVADAAERLGSRSVWLTKPLQTRQVLAKTALINSDGNQRGLLVSIDALINVVSSREPQWRRGGAAGDPASVEDGGAVPQAGSEQGLANHCHGAHAASRCWPVGRGIS
ncbi:TniQ family protein [Pseudomonas taiwanensis]|uniref:TniQ family protein n=1 Tax=Pseudomonas taiwanensis TaxID=470150 RepID=UPI0015BEEDB5|nr:TniQ family protein [Pseudomonas taiwanensis]